MPNIQYIGIIGSRKLLQWQFEQLEELAFLLSQEGYKIVSGGAKEGGDRAAENGSDRAKKGANLTLYLSREFHGHNKYPQYADLRWVDPAHQYDGWNLAREHALPEQWNSRYRPLFVRNGYVATASDAIISWQNGDTRGTEHTIRCAAALEKPLLRCDRTYKQRPWKNADQLYTRISLTLAQMRS